MTNEPLDQRLRVLISARQIYDAWLLLRTAFDNSLYRFVIERTPPEKADDVCRDVWNSVYQALPAYRAEGSHRSWLLGLAQARLNERAVATERASTASALFLARAFGALPVRRTELPVLERAIAALQADERELLDLRYVNGLGAPAIAVLLGRSVRAIEEDLGSIIDGLRVLGRAMSTRPSPSPASRVPVRRGKGHFVLHHRSTHRTGLNVTKAGG